MTACSTCNTRGAFAEPATLWTLSLLADQPTPDCDIVELLVGSVSSPQQSAAVAGHPSIPPDAALRVVDAADDPATVTAYLFRPDTELGEVLSRIGPAGGARGFSEEVLVALPDRLALSLSLSGEDRDELLVRRDTVLSRLVAVGSPQVCASLLCNERLPTEVRAAAAPAAMRDPQVFESLFALSPELKCAAFDTFIDYPWYLFDGFFDFHPLGPDQAAALVDVFEDWFGNGFDECFKRLNDGTFSVVDNIPHLLDRHGPTAGVHGLCAAIAVNLLTHPQLPDRSRHALVGLAARLFRVDDGARPGPTFTFGFFHTAGADMTFDGFMLLFETLQQLTGPLPADRFVQARTGQIDAGLFDDLPESVLTMLLEDPRFGPELRLRLASRPDRPNAHSPTPRHGLLVWYADTLLEAAQISASAPDEVWQDPFPIKHLDPPPTSADVAAALLFADDHALVKSWLQEWLLAEAPAEMLTDEVLPLLLCDERLEELLLPGCGHTGVFTSEQTARAGRIVGFLRSRLGTNLGAWRMFADLADSSTTLGFAADLAASLELIPATAG